MRLTSGPTFAVVVTLAIFLFIVSTWTEFFVDKDTRDTVGDHKLEIEKLETDVRILKGDIQNLEGQILDLEGQILDYRDKAIKTP